MRLTAVPFSAAAILELSVECFVNSCVDERELCTYNNDTNNICGAADTFREQQKLTVPLFANQDTMFDVVMERFSLGMVTRWDPLGKVSLRLFSFVDFVPLFSFADFIAQTISRQKVDNMSAIVVTNNCRNTSKMPENSSPSVGSSANDGASSNSGGSNSATVTVAVVVGIVVVVAIIGTVIVLMVR